MTKDSQGSLAVVCHEGYLHEIPPESQAGLLGGLTSWSLSFDLVEVILASETELMTEAGIHLSEDRWPWKA